MQGFFVILTFFLAQIYEYMLSNSFIYNVLKLFKEALNKGLDLFGSTVSKAACIISFSERNTIAVCKNTLADADLQTFLNTHAHAQTTIEETLKRIPGLTRVALLQTE